MRQTPDRPTSPPAIATALAFALIVVALSGGQHRPTVERPAEPQAALSDDERSRLIAAAVTATRELLGIEHETVAALPAEMRPPVMTVEAPALRPPTPLIFTPLIRPAPRLTNLPPPTC